MPMHLRELRALRTKLRILEKATHGTATYYGAGILQKIGHRAAAGQQK